MTVEYCGYVHLYLYGTNVQQQYILTSSRACWIYLKLGLHQTDAADEYNEPKPYTISSDCSGDFLIYASLSRQGEPLCALMTGIVSPDPGAQLRLRG